MQELESSGYCLHLDGGGIDDYMYERSDALHRAFRLGAYCLVCGACCMF